MRLLINHLTRMHGGHICLAGVDLETRRHVRPMLANDPLPFYLLARYGGPFDMGRIVDLGSPRHAPDPPHVEDYVFVPARAKVDRPAAAHEFWRLLEEMAVCESAGDFRPGVAGGGTRPVGDRLGQGTAVARAAAARRAAGTLSGARPRRQAANPHEIDATASFRPTPA